MFTQILVGSLITCLNVSTQVGFIVAAIVVLRHLKMRSKSTLRYGMLVLVLTGTTLWLLLGLTASAFTWAFGFLGIGLFNTLEDATYFAIVSFTTLGFGDVLLPKEWQLLSGICAAAGLMLFGLSTAFLFEVFGRLIRTRDETNGAA